MLRRCGGGLYRRGHRHARSRLIGAFAAPTTTSIPAATAAAVAPHWRHQVVSRSRDGLMNAASPTSSISLRSALGSTAGSRFARERRHAHNSHISTSNSTIFNNTISFRNKRRRQSVVHCATASQHTSSGDNHHHHHDNDNTMSTDASPSPMTASPRLQSSVEQASPSSQSQPDVKAQWRATMWQGAGICAIVVGAYGGYRLARFYYSQHQRSARGLDSGSSRGKHDVSSREAGAPQRPSETECEPCKEEEDSGVIASITAAISKKMPGLDSVMPDTAARALRIVADGMSRTVGGVGPWGLAEITFGLYALAKYHERARVQDSVGKDRPLEVDEVKELLRDIELVDAAYYGESEEDKVAFLNQDLNRRKALMRGYVYKYVAQSGILDPAYFMCVDDEIKCIVLCIRGTASPADMLTDLTGTSERCEADDEDSSFYNHFVHCGMLHSSRNLVEKERQSLQELLAQHPGYGLKVIGHSLGAGTAALVTMALRESKEFLEAAGIERTAIRCLAFAPPACVSARLADDLADAVTSIVLQDDIVPRASLSALEDLRTEILLTDWKTAVGVDDKDTGAIMLYLHDYVSQAMQQTQPTMQQVEAWIRHSGSLKRAKEQFGGKDKLEEVEEKTAQSSEDVTQLSKAMQLMRSWGIDVSNLEDQQDRQKEAKRDPKQDGPPPSPALDETQRLYPPGKLVHIIRVPEEGNKDKDNDNVHNNIGNNNINGNKALDGEAVDGHGEEESTSSSSWWSIGLWSSDTSDKNNGDSNGNNSNDNKKVRYEAWWGEPGQRFEKIVLSDGMVNDHFTEQYRDALRAVLQRMAPQEEEAAEPVAAKS